MQGRRKDLKRNQENKITLEELETEFIKRQRYQKHPDSFKTEMLKEARYLTLDTLRRMFNKVIRTKTTSEAWQVVKLCSIKL